MDTCACLCELKDPLASYQQEALPPAYLQCAVVAMVKIKFGECLTETSGRTKATTIENADWDYICGGKIGGTVHLNCLPDAAPHPSDRQEIILNI